MQSDITSVVVHRLADHFQELCGDGLLEALGVTTNGERGISDEAWSHFVNNVRIAHTMFETCW